jgi:PAS domain S-box-containing protein
MKISKTFLTGFIFFFLGIFLLAFFLFLYRQINALNESSELVNHANVVKLKLSEAIISLKDVETAQHEYLLTRDSVFLFPYKNACDHFTKSLDEIDSLVKDNSWQQINILALKVFSKTHLMVLDDFAMRPEKSSTVLTADLLDAKVKMDNIRSQIKIMSDVEDSLLNKRVKMREKNSFITPWSALVFFIFTLIILLFSFFKINKNYHTQSKLKDEILTSKIFLQSLLDATSELIAAFDKDLRLAAINKSTEEKYNISRESVIGKHFYEIFPALKGTENARLIENVLTGKPVLNHTVKSHLVGSIFEVNMVPLSSPSGETNGILIIGRDITELVHATTALQQKNEELERSNQELTSFSYVASHDLQEPLRKIQSFSNRILEKEGGQFSETTKDYFKRIVSAARRMQDLIDALLNFSRTNTAELVFEPVDLNSIIEEVKTSLKENIEEKNAVVEAASLPVLSVIPLQFFQLMLNLVSNSLKYSKAGIHPHIKISAEVIAGQYVQPPAVYPFEKYWKISVEDNGIGFEQQYENKIFELFQRLHGKLEYGGTGIGLAICKKIVQNHNGVISAVGKPGVGATFNVYLPAQ